MRVAVNHRAMPPIIPIITAAAVVVTPIAVSASVAAIAVAVAPVVAATIAPLNKAAAAAVGPAAVFTAEVVWVAPATGHIIAPGGLSVKALACFVVKVLQQAYKKHGCCCGILLYTDMLANAPH